MRQSSSGLGEQVMAHIGSLDGATDEVVEARENWEKEEEEEEEEEEEDE